MISEVYFSKRKREPFVGQNLILTIIFVPYLAVARHRDVIDFLLDLKRRKTINFSLPSFRDH